MKISELSVLWSFNIKSQLEWIENYAKNFELSRRASLAAMAKTEKERESIQGLSEAFAYLLNIDWSAGNNFFGISIERVPAKSNNEIENQIIEETSVILNSVLGEEVRYTLSNSEEFQKIVTEQIKPQIIQEIKSVLGGDAS